MKQDLHTMRDAIDQFTEEKGHSPESLDDLVRAGYLRDIPLDPTTNSRLTWKAVYEDTLKKPDNIPAKPPKNSPKTHGIVDVHSGSVQISSEGTPYDSW